MSCGADTNAKLILSNLTAGEDFTIPEVDLTGSEYEIPGGANSDIYKPVKALTNDQLTERQVNGNGTFDYLMGGTSVWLQAEYKAGRISGAEYTKAWIGLTEACIGGAVQYLLGRDQAFWAGANAQIAAITGKVGLATARVQYAAEVAQMLTRKSEFALTTMKLSTEDNAYCQGQFQLEQILPHQSSLLQEQVRTAAAQTVLTISQQNQVKEATEAQRAQTSDTRLDGTPVSGILGEQKKLYAQQILSYKRDAETKAAKMWVDAWITQKTMDEGVIPPGNFTNTVLDQVLTSVKNNNNL